MNKLFTHPGGNNSSKYINKHDMVDRINGLLELKPSDTFTQQFPTIDEAIATPLGQDDLYTYRQINFHKNTQEPSFLVHLALNTKNKNLIDVREFSEKSYLLAQRTLTMMIEEIKRQLRTTNDNIGLLSEILLYLQRMSSNIEDRSGQLHPETVRIMRTHLAKQKFGSYGIMQPIQDLFLRYLSEIESVGFPLFTPIISSLRIGNLANLTLQMDNKSKSLQKIVQTCINSKKDPHLLEILSYLENDPNIHPIYIAFCEVHEAARGNKYGEILLSQVNELTENMTSSKNVSYAIMDKENPHHLAMMRSFENAGYNIYPMHTSGDHLAYLALRIKRQ